VQHEAASGARWRLGGRGAGSDDGLAPRPRLRAGRGRRVGRGRRWEPDQFVLAAAWLAWTVLAALGLFLVWQAWPAISGGLAGTAPTTSSGWLGRVWQPSTGQFGLLPLIAGSGWVTVLAAAV